VRVCASPCVCGVRRCAKVIATAEAFAQDQLEKVGVVEPGVDAPTEMTGAQEDDEMTGAQVDDEMTGAQVDDDTHDGTCSVCAGACAMRVRASHATRATCGAVRAVRCPSQRRACTAVRCAPRVLVTTRRRRHASPRWAVACRRCPPPRVPTCEHDPAYGSARLSSAFPWRAP
jgi:hypothetical protein